MKGILNQWKIYINWINYNIFLKKNLNNVIVKSNKLEKELKDKIEDYESFSKKKSEYLGVIKYLNNPNKSLKLYFEGVNVSNLNLFQKLKRKIFNYDGYVFYLNKSDDLKIFKVKNLKFLYDLKNKKETYNLNDKFGTYKGKPFFLIKYPFTISLNCEGEELFYDCEAYNNYVNSATKINLTNLGSNFNLMEFISKNIIYIVLGIALILLFTTPQGQEFLKGILPK